MSDETRTPSLDHVLDLLVEEALDNARSMLPGRVTDYDEDRQCVSVQILIKTGHVDADGDRVVRTIGEIHEVPVWFLGAQAGGRITVPVAKGDTGMLVFASMSIARWKLKGGLVDPGDDRRHDLNDCFFMPGGHDFAHVPTTAPTNAIVTHGKTKLGGPTGTSKVVVETALTQFCQALVNAAITLSSQPVNAPGLAALVALANELFGGDFDPLDPPTSFALWPAGTDDTEAK